jgi:hypothetical protein
MISSDERGQLNYTGRSPAIAKEFDIDACPPLTKAPTDFECGELDRMRGTGEPVAL